MTVRLRVRELAEAKGLNISSFQRQAQIPMSTARRLWYSTSDGKEDGPRLQSVNLSTLDQLAEFFRVDPGKLLFRE
jgi:hypothetical protein